MGASVEHLQKDPRTGRLSFRRAFAPELRPHIPGQPRELKRSLAARNIAEPGAMDRFKRAASDYERLASQARKVAAGTFDPLDAPTIAYLAETFRVERLEEDEAARWDPEERELTASIRSDLQARGVPFADAWAARQGERWAVKRLETVEAALAGHRSLQGRGDEGAIVQEWTEEALDLTQAKGLRVDPSAPAFRQLCRALNVAAIQSEEAMLERLRGGLVPTPEDPMPPAAVKVLEAPSPPSPRLSFGEIAEGLLENTRLRIGAATRQSSRTALRFLREAIGDLPPSAITRRLVAEFLDLLAQRPAKLPQAERSLPLREIIALYQGREDVPRLTPKTLEQHLGSLSTLWTKAQDRDEVPQGLPNPFKQKLAGAPPRENPTGLTRLELEAIFSLPVFTKGQRPAGGKGEASYWLPLLLLWTGARPEELAQLMVADVIKDQETGRWLLKITDEGTHPHKGKRSLKTAKTLSGRRGFPIPRPVLDLGFLEYVAAMRDCGETALFPKLRTKGERGLLFAGFSEWWSGYLREHGVALAPGKRPAREFRHTWTTAARASGLPREAMEYIQGHKAVGGSAHEIYGSREPLGRWIDELRFEGLDLSAVRPWRTR